ILLDATLNASDVVIVSPLYWYSVSASVKLYLDHWGGWLSLPELQFRSRMRGKTMWAITTTGTNDIVKAAPLVDSLRLSAEYLAMNWGGELVTTTRPDNDATALDRADALFRPDGRSWETTPEAGGDVADPGRRGRDRRQSRRHGDRRVRAVERSGTAE